MGTAFSYSGNLFFSKSFIRLVGKNFLWKKCFLIRVIFLLVETIIEIWVKKFSKKQLSFASGQLIISLVEISIFTDRDQLMLVEAFFFFNWNVFLRAYSRKWATNFLVSGNHIFSPFLRDPCQWQYFFCQVKTCYSRKLSILASGNGFRANNGFQKEKKKL